MRNMKICSMVAIESEEVGHTSSLYDVKLCNQALFYM